MYERSAIVLERYFDRIFGFNKENNLKTNYENYCKIIEEVKEYEKTLKEEEKIIEKFDEVAQEIETIQKRQAELHESNVELETERNRLFNDLGENPNTIDNKLQEIEKVQEKNEEELRVLREKYVKALVIFMERQKERNRYSRIRRTTETNHIHQLKEANEKFKIIDGKDIQAFKKILDIDTKNLQEELLTLLSQNGKSEKVPFCKEVLEKATKERIEIALKEAELYKTIYEKNKKLLEELNSENIKLGRAEKIARDTSIKLTFLNAEKEYIIGFLDNERMTAMNGKKAHEKLMKEACENFLADMEQIHKLYELVMKETTGKATKKVYKELYNKTYLKDIQEKEKNFEEEVTNIKIQMGTLINSNYWRIEGMKNIYYVFQEEISEKLGKDLSEYQLEEIEDEGLSMMREIEEMYQEKQEEEEEFFEKEEFYEEEEDELEEEDNDYVDVEFDEEELDDEEEKWDDDEIWDEEEEEDDDWDEEDDEGITEDKIDQIIRNSRKPKNKKEDHPKKGLFGKLFKK